MVWKFTVGIIVYFTTLCQKIETLSYLECVTMFLTNILTIEVLSFVVHRIEGSNCGLCICTPEYPWVLESTL